jgi:Na+-translocating ferredoxin:NAD+ oxidoreductase RnfD subunit
VTVAAPITGMRYPVVLPSVRDPRLHLAAVITSLQVLGQVAFAFDLSIAQILISIGTCAVLEVTLVLRRQRLLAWPASALLTGNSVAFILRVPGTEHGDWWSTKGWWIFAATAAVSLFSKYVIRLRGRHVFNPSNLGLVVCFLALGPERADPLDFWWGPMSPALAVAVAIIVVGAFAILSRLRLLAMALSFWLVFVAAVSVVAATGHTITARWHLGPVGGLQLWTVLAFSPEIMVFLFFMLTDPKTVPTGRRERVVFGVAVALLAALLVAGADSEFQAKVGVLAALTVVCAARAALAIFRRPIRVSRRSIALLAAAGLAAYVGALAAVGLASRTAPAPARPAVRLTRLPAIEIRPSRGVDGKLDRATATRITADVVADLASRPRRITLWLEAGSGQAAVIVARLEGPGRPAETVEISQSLAGYAIARVRR